MYFILQQCLVRLLFPSHNQPHLIEALFASSCLFVCCFSEQRDDALCLLNATNLENGRPASESSRPSNTCVDNASSEQDKERIESLAIALEKMTKENLSKRTEVSRLESKFLVFIFLASLSLAGFTL